MTKHKVLIRRSFIQMTSLSFISWRQTIQHSFCSKGNHNYSLTHYPSLHFVFSDILLNCHSTNMRAFDLNDSLDDEISFRLAIEPLIGQSFFSDEEAIQFYTRFAEMNGSQFIKPLTVLSNSINMGCNTWKDVASCSWEKPILSLGEKVMEINPFFLEGGGDVRSSMFVSWHLLSSQLVTSVEFLCHSGCNFSCTQLLIFFKTAMTVMSLSCCRELPQSVSFDIFSSLPGCFVNEQNLRNWFSSSNVHSNLLSFIMQMLNS